MRNLLRKYKSRGFFYTPFSIVKSANFSVLNWAYRMTQHTQWPLTDFDNIINTVIFFRIWSLQLSNTTSLCPAGLSEITNTINTSVNQAKKISVFLPGLPYYNPGQCWPLINCIQLPDVLYYRTFMYYILTFSSYTVCPKSLDPFYI